MKADRKDLLGGAIVLVMGACFAIGALDYRLGTLARMGPGFVPLTLGLIGMALGAAIMLSAIGREGRLAALMPAMVLPVLAAILAFALLLPRAGLLPAVFVSILLSSLSSPRSTLRGAVILAVCVSALISICFVLLLGVQIPLIRRPF